MERSEMRIYQIACEGNGIAGIFVIGINSVLQIISVSVWEMNIPHHQPINLITTQILYDLNFVWL
jgi:hypothetical protein